MITPWVSYPNSVICLKDKYGRYIKSPVYKDIQRKAIDPEPHNFTWVGIIGLVKGNTTAFEPLNCLPHGTLVVVHPFEALPLFVFYPTLLLSAFLLSLIPLSFISLSLSHSILSLPLPLSLPSSVRDSWPKTPGIVARAWVPSLSASRKKRWRPSWRPAVLWTSHRSWANYRRNRQLSGTYTVYAVYKHSSARENKWRSYNQRSQSPSVFGFWCCCRPEPVVEFLLQWVLIPRENRPQRKTNFP